MSKHILFIFLILSTTLINLTKCDDTSVKEVKEETELVDTNDGETISNYDHDYDFLMEEDPTSDPEVDHGTLPHVSNNGHGEDAGGPAKGVMMVMHGGDSVDCGVCECGGDADTVI